MAALVRLTSKLGQLPFKCLKSPTQNRICGQTNFATKHSDIKISNSAKDVILYSYDNHKFHKHVNILGLSQLVFWLFLAEYSTHVLKKPPVTEDDSESSSSQVVGLEDKKRRNGYAPIFVGLGVTILVAGWIYSLRCIKNVILRKSGKDVTLITYGPYTKLRYLDIPLEKVSAVGLRSKASEKLPIKVKGHVGHFFIDMRGEFKNKTLFDSTVGFKRNFKR